MADDYQQEDDGDNGSLHDEERDYEDGEDAYDDDEVPYEVEIERLKSLVSDLSRRLQNAQHTIDAERRISMRATAQATMYRQRVSDFSTILRLEIAKNLNLERKKVQETESNRYEFNKKKAQTLSDDLRLVEIDHMMTGFKKEPLKLTKLRQKLQNVEKEQESQRKLLQQFGELEKLNENLSTAAQEGDLEKCMLLLRSGATVNFLDPAGYMPIHYACANGFYDIVKLMLEYGADHSSYLTGHASIVTAATFGHIKIAKLLVDFGANLEDKGKNNCTAVIEALKAGHLECMEFLLSIGADIDSCDANENTLLHWATSPKLAEHSLRLIQFLLQKGIDFNRVNRNNHTALQKALYEKNTNAISAFSAAGMGPPQTMDMPSECGYDVTAMKSASMKNSTAQIVASSGGVGSANHTKQTKKTKIVVRSVSGPIHVKTRSKKDLLLRSGGGGDSDGVGRGDQLTRGPDGNPVMVDAAVTPANNANSITADHQKMASSVPAHFREGNHGYDLAKVPSAVGVSTADHLENGFSSATHSVASSVTYN